MDDAIPSVREERLEALFGASLRLFARYGYARTRVEDIARELGMTKGNLYFYVRNKEELYLRTVEWALDSWRLSIERSVMQAKAREEGAAERFSRMARGAFDYMKRHPELRAVLEADQTIYSLDPTADRFAEVNRKARDLLERLIAEGQARGEFRKDLDLGASVDFLYAVYIAFLMKTWSLREGRSALRLFEAGIDLALKGLVLPRARTTTEATARKRRHS